MQIPGAWVDLVREAANEVLRGIGTRYRQSTLHENLWHKLTIFWQLDAAGSFTATAIHQRNGRRDVNPGVLFFTAVVSTILTNYLPSFQNQDILISQI